MNRHALALAVSFSLALAFASHSCFTNAQPLAVCVHSSIEPSTQSITPRLRSRLEIQGDRQRLQTHDLKPRHVPTKEAESSGHRCGGAQ